MIAKVCGWCDRGTLTGCDREPWRERTSRQELTLTIRPAGVDDLPLILCLVHKKADVDSVPHAVRSVRVSLT